MKFIEEDRNRIDSAVSPIAGLFSKVLLVFAASTAPVAGQTANTNVPVASNVSAVLSAPAILGTMEKVADWQLAQPPRHPTDEWTYGALYTGMMALSRIAATPRYHAAMVEMGKSHEWKPRRRIYHADDHCVCQMYLELYLQDHDPAMLAPTKERFDYILANQRTNDLNFTTRGSQDRWSWCDALFMGPPAWARLYKATGDQRYLDFMDKEWWATSDFLYDTNEHLFFRDSTYFDKRESNGKKIFWSRGNGWVMAGIARVLEMMPENYPHRTRYERQFKEMAEKIASLQQPDGLWRSSLLDPEAYPLKETSGSGFYVFALAWGINHGLLDAAKYGSVARKGWQALVGCVTPDGKLEHVQPVGADPKKFEPTYSDVYGVGAFLLAGSEMYRLSGGQHGSAEPGGEASANSGLKFAKGNFESAEQPRFAFNKPLKYGKSKFNCPTTSPNTSAQSAFSGPSQTLWW